MAETVADRPARRVSIVGRSVYGTLLPVPVVCFMGALLSDLAYLGSHGNLLWLNFSSWLILFGLLFGAIAAIVLLIEYIRTPARGASGWWAQLPFFYAALLVELFSAFVHDRDGWTAVAGTGIILSIIGALLILVAAWLHRPSLVEVVR